MGIKYTNKILEHLADNTDYSLDDLFDLIDVVDNITSCQDMADRKANSIKDLRDDGLLIKKFLRAKAATKKGKKDEK